jgi:macrolide-specific efflux system membrane fusion protein
MIKNKKMILALVAVIVAVLIFIGMKVKAGRSQVKQTVVRAVLGEIREIVSTTGTVKPQNRLEIKPPVAGRIEEILVKEGQDVKAGKILALMSSTERAALLDAARLQGEEETAYWKSVYNATPLIAPIDGMVIVRSVEPGQTVTTADAVIVLSDRLIVEADVDETDIGSVAVGQKAVVSLDAYPEISVLSIVDHISYESSLVNNVMIYSVDILPDEIPDVFRSGMSANVDIIIKEKTDAVLLPADAVMNRDGKEIVVLQDMLNNGQKAVSVVTGMRDSENIEIVSGVSAGDAVILSYQDFSALLATSASGSNPFMPARGKGRK